MSREPQHCVGELTAKEITLNYLKSVKAELHRTVEIHEGELEGLQGKIYAIDTSIQEILESEGNRRWTSV